MPGIQRAGDNASTDALLEAIAGFITSGYDYIGVAYPTSTTETYTYKTGGSSGTTVGTVTVTYTDSTKADLDNVALS